MNLQSLTLLHHPSYQAIKPSLNDIKQGQNGHCSSPIKLPSPPLAGVPLLLCLPKPRNDAEAGGEGAGDPLSACEDKLPGLRTLDSSSSSYCSFRRNRDALSALNKPSPGTGNEDASQPAPTLAVSIALPTIPFSLQAKTPRNVRLVLITLSPCGYLKQILASGAVYTTLS